MKLLLLNGYSINMHVDGAKLHIKEGRFSTNEEPQEYVFAPKFIDVDNIVIYGHTGNISLDAIRWLVKQNVQVSMLNWDGRFLTSILPIESKQSFTRLAQFRAFESNKRIEVAKKIIDAKINNSIIVLKWLGERYPDIIKLTDDMKEIEQNRVALPQASTIKEIMGFEGMVARIYWNIISSLFDEKLEFNGRIYGKTNRPMGSVDPVNTLLNYGYAILESQCWKAINSNGLDPYIGFMHEMQRGKAPLVYDLQEPFRWLVDVTVISCLEKRMFTKKDFIITENYNLRLRPEGAKKLTVELMKQFSTTVNYDKHNFEWNYVIVKKTYELAQYLIGNKKSLDFSVPEPDSKRDDSGELRDRIKGLSYKKWKDMGFSKGTLHYLKHNVSNEKPFKIYGKVKEKLMEMEYRN